MCMRRRTVTFTYPQTNMVSLLGIYFDIKRNDMTHSPLNVNKVYIILTTNRSLSGGEGLKITKDI